MFQVKVTCLYRLCLNKIKQKINPFFNSFVANMMFVQENSIVSEYTVVGDRCQQLSAVVSKCQQMSAVVSSCQQLAVIGRSWR